MEDIFVVVCWPDSQILMEYKDMHENTILINDEPFVTEFGSSAYLVRQSWLDEIKEETIKLEPIYKMGMDLIEITYKSCVATVATGDGWATVYSIESSKPGKGHCQELLKQAKKFYGEYGKVFGSTVALNNTMKHILKKLEIPEYD